MILERWEDIDKDTIAELCDSNAPETISLDFKQELYGSSQDDKAEFLKDVCALANSEGGDIVFGIAEAKGGAGRAMPIIDPSADRAMRKMGQILDGSVEPRLPAFHWKQVNMDGGGYVLVLRVPKSLIGPHRFVVSNMSRFPIRNGTHIADMSYEQLRTAFDRTATLSDRAKEFRQERVRTLLAGKTQRALEVQTCAVIHLLPLNSFGGQSSVDVVDAYNRVNDLALGSWSRLSKALNLDGCFVYGTGRDSEILYYSQLYRNGAIETFRGGFGIEREDRTYIPTINLGRFVREALGRALTANNRFGPGGGAFIALSMLNVQGELGISQMFNSYNTPESDRPHLVLPEVWVNDTSSYDLDEVMRPLLDTLWQCFGVERCNLFKEDGSWDNSPQVS